MLSVKSFEFSPIQENTYILYNEFNECILIDPGCYSDDEKDRLVAFITKMGLTPKMLLNTHVPFDNYTGELVFLNEGDTIRLGDNELKVLLTPGHSPASLSFYCQKDGFVIGGDVLFKRSIGRTDLPGGNYETLIRSIRGQLLVLPEATVVYSGHGFETTIGDEKRANPFLV
jgi:hydroxyacylglutathione hydrolase